MRGLTRQACSSSQGAVLLLCLFLLIALSLLGLAAASDQQLQERINGNIETARQDEENSRLSSLWAQAWLSALPGDAVPAVCEGGCPAGAAIHAPGSLSESPGTEGLDWWQANAYQAGFDPVSGSLDALPGLSGNAQAHWLVEELRRQPLDGNGEPGATVGWYRILARGSGGLHATSFISEAIVARPWGDAAWRTGPPHASEPGQLCALMPAGVDCGRQAWRELP